MHVYTALALAEIAIFFSEKHAFFAKNFSERETQLSRPSATAKLAPGASAAQNENRALNEKGATWADASEGAN